MVVPKEIDTNAANAQKGFYYQDMVALYILLRDIKKINYINPEGEDDIDVMYENGKKSYYQAKYVNNIDNSKVMPEKLGEALKTLYADYIREEGEVEELIFVTNSRFPLGKTRSYHDEFFRHKAYYNYKALPAEFQRKIINKVKSLKFDSDIDLEKISVLKISYEGSDTATRMRALDDLTNEFFEQTRINCKQALVNSWFKLIRDSDTVKDKILTKQEFYSNTIAIVVFQDDRGVEDFLECYDIRSMRNKIKDNYEYVKNLFIDDFQEYNKIIQCYSDDDSNYSDTYKRKFIDEYSNNVLNVTNKNDDDLWIVKLSIWMAIQANQEVIDIKKEIGYG